MFRLLYVSISTLTDASTHSEIEKIVRGSVVFNARQGITGALIFAAGHFAQALEGEEAKVNNLMREILLDNRHRCVTVVRREQITKPRFAPWSMAYNGAATYVGRPIESLLQATGNAKAAEIHRVYSLMDELIASQPPS